MMSTAKSHPIWNYFKKNDGGNRSWCNKCCTQITCPNSGTTNMIQHLQRKHLGLLKLYSKEKEKFDRQKQKTRKRKPDMILNHPKITNFAHAPVFAANDPRQTTVTRAIAEMLAIDMEPFSKVGVGVGLGLGVGVENHWVRRWRSIFNLLARVAFYYRWPSITGGRQLQVLR